MFGTAGLKWKEADLITICKPSAHMQTSKNPRILKSLKSQSVQKGFFSSNVKSYFWRHFFSHLLFCQQMWHLFSSKVALVFSAFLSRKSFAILTENKWAFECTWSPLAINQAKRPPQHFMRKLYLYSIKRLQNHLSFKSDDLLSCVEDQMVFCISITQYFSPSQCHLTHNRGD